MRPHPIAAFAGALALAAFTGMASAGDGYEEDYIGLTKESADELQLHFKHAQWEGVKNLFGAAKAVLIAPDVTSGAFVVGVEKGAGVLLARHADAWSDPVFVKLSTTSVGVQAGAKESEALMLILTRSAVDKLVNGASRVGGTGGFALGNLGIGGSGGGGISGGMETLTFNTSEGLSLGGGIADIELALDDDFNTAAYGADFDMAEIMSKPGGQLEVAEALRATLEQAVEASWYE